MKTSLYAVILVTLDVGY